MTRLRPVVMTALAMIIGMVDGPARGGASRMRRSAAVIGGLLVATVATLFLCRRCLLFCAAGPRRETPSRRTRRTNRHALNEMKDENSNHSNHEPSSHPPRGRPVAARPRAPSPGPAESASRRPWLDPARTDRAGQGGEQQQWRERARCRSHATACTVTLFIRPRRRVGPRPCCRAR